MRPTSPTCARAPSRRSVPGISRGAIRKCSATSAHAARRTGTCGCSIRCSISMKSACIRVADIVVEASRLERPAPLLMTAWIAKGACVIPYGTMSAVELTLTDIMDKIVVDDWGQAGAGPFGSLRAHVDSGRLSEANLHAELGQIVAGVKRGRESDAETNLFW